LRGNSDANAKVANISNSLIYKISLTELVQINNLEIPSFPNTLELQNPPKDALPLIIIEATKYFAKYLAQFSVTKNRSSKHTNTTTQIEGLVAPCESFYHCELYAVLSRWLTDCRTTFLFTEVNVVGRYKLDLLLECNGKLYCLELLASGDETIINTHFETITRYTEAIKPYESWLIHYTMSSNMQLWTKKYDRGNPKVKQLNIRHDLEWKNFTYWYTGLTTDSHFVLE